MKTFSSRPWFTQSKSYGASNQRCRICFFMVLYVALNVASFLDNQEGAHGFKKRIERAAKRLLFLGAEGRGLQFLNSVNKTEFKKIISSVKNKVY